VYRTRPPQDFRTNRLWFKKAVASTEELVYMEALDWFGPRLMPGDAKAKTWRLGGARWCHGRVAVS
jgi:hypothetical protein